MSLNLKFQVTGDSEFVRKLEKYPKTARKAARMSINDTIKRGRRMVKREIQTQVNLKPSYINSSRLSENLATDDNLVGSIVGRRRPTSLARFDAKQLYRSNTTKSGKKSAGVSVRVKRSRKTIPNAFLINLKNGNRGLAVRLPEGKKPRRRFGGKPLYKNRDSNVWLLYGPSINQVMTGDAAGESIVESLQPRLTSYLNREFTRQFGRLYSGK